MQSELTVLRQALVALSEQLNQPGIQWDLAIEANAVVSARERIDSAWLNIDQALLILTDY